MLMPGQIPEQLDLSHLSDHGWLTDITISLEPSINQDLNFIQSLGCIPHQAWLSDLGEPLG